MWRQPRSYAVAPLSSRYYGSAGSAIVWGLWLCVACCVAQQVEPPPAVNPPPEKQAEPGNAPPDEGQVQNQWKQIFRGLLGREMEAATEAAPAAQQTLAPLDARLNGLMNRALRDLSRGRPGDAAEVLQRILAEPEDSLYPVGLNRYSSLRTFARKTLRKLPPAEQERYRQQVTGDAERALTAALTSNSIAQLADTASRYLLLEAGQRAADRLVARSLDRGEMALAAHWCRELLEIEAPLTRQAAWQARAEFIAQRAEDTDISKQLSKLRPAAEAPLTVAGQPTTRQDWLKSLPAAAGFRLPVIEEWLVPFGTPQRVATTAAGEPLLLSRWSWPMSEREPVQTLFANLLSDLRNERRVPLTACQPLFVDGKVIFRTLRGVKVLSAETGQLLWETNDACPIEDLFGEEPADEESPNPPAQGKPAGPVLLNRPARAQGGPMIGSVWSADDMGESHPLSQVVLQNSNFGAISSDGERVFVLEDQSFLPLLSDGAVEDVDLNPTDYWGRPLGTNRLVAYDLQTGGELWGVGGPVLSDSFGGAISGTFFFGPPVAAGQELFVVGERQREIRLFVLHPQTGELLWSQLLARAPQKISQDTHRQRVSAPVAIGSGIILCPTTVGWLVAVDRNTRTILWARELDPSQRPGEEEGMGSMMETGLDGHWRSMSPMLLRNQVLYAPPEGKQIFCLKLSTGEILWKKPKDRELFIATVTPQKLVTASRTHLRGHELTRGGRSWELKYGSLEQRPTGRGVLVGGVYHQPLSGGELWSVEVETGQLLRKQFLPRTAAQLDRELGHLTLYRGRLISAGPLGLSAYEELHAFETALTAEQNSSLTAYRRAERELLQQNFTAAQQALGTVQTDQLPAEHVAQFRQTQWNVLSAAVRAEPLARDAEFLQLEALAQQPEQRLQLRTMRAQRLLARAAWPELIALYLEWSQHQPEQDWVVDAETERLVRGDAWLAGEWRALWPRLSPELQGTVTQRVSEWVNPLVTAGDAQAARQVRIYGFLPVAIEWEAALIAAHVQAQEYSLAEVRLQRWIDRADRGLEIRALQELVRACAAGNLAGDAVHYAERLAQLEAQIPFAAESPERALLTEWQPRLQAAAAPPELSNWHGASLRAERMGVDYRGFNTEVNLVRVASDLPYFQQHRVEFDAERERVNFINRATEQQVWTCPLSIRSQRHAVSSGQLEASTVGHLLVINYGGLLTALAPLEQRVLWSHPLDPSSEVHYFFEEFDGALHSRSGPGELEPLARISLPELMEQDLTVVHRTSSECVVVRSQRRLQGLDPLTGEVLWKREGLPSQANFDATSELILVALPAQKKMELWSTWDGRSLNPDNWSAHAELATFFVENHLVEMARDKPKDLPQGQQLWQARHPVTGQIRWKLPLPSGTTGAWLPGHQCVLMAPDFQLQLLDLRTGQVRSLGRLDPADMKRMSDVVAVKTRETLYLIVNQKSRFQGELFPEDFATQRISGQLIALDLRRGEQRWKQAIANQYLATELLGEGPVCLLASRKFRQQAFEGQWTVHLEAYDAWTGQQVFKVESSVQAGYDDVSFNLPGRYVELRSYNERLRLMPVAPAP